VPDPRAVARRASLLRRSEPRWSACSHWTAASPRSEDEVRGPSTWPEPSAEHTCEDSNGYGTVRVRAWANLHPKVCAYMKVAAAVGHCPSWSGRLYWWR
jgi:hypothetical protein